MVCDGMVTGVSPYLVNASQVQVHMYQSTSVCIWSNALIYMVCQYFGKSPMICNYMPAAMSYFEGADLPHG